MASSIASKESWFFQSLGQIARQMQNPVLKPPIFVLQLGDALILLLVSSDSGYSSGFALMEKRVPEKFELLQNLFLKHLQIGMLFRADCIGVDLLFCSKACRV